MSSDADLAHAFPTRPVNSDRDPRASAILVSLAQERGLSASVCLAGTGLALEDLFEHRRPISGAEELAIARNVVLTLGNPVELGCDAGARVRFGMLGGWGHAIRTAPTPADAFRIALTYGYGRFSWVFTRPWMTASTPFVRVTFDAAGLPDDLSAFLIARDMIFTVSLLPNVFGPSIPMHLETTFDPMVGAALAGAAAPWNVYFRHAENTLVFDRSVMEHSMPYGDPDAMATFEREWRPAASGGRPSNPAGVASLIYAEVMRRPFAPITLEEAAAERHVTTRTLRRQLAAEGTSFREVIDSARKTIAIELLTQAGLTADQLARRLGFTDAGNFTRAFKRWTGLTPAAYRREHS